MTSPSLLRLCLAGFLGTFAMTLALYPAFVYGIPKMDFATLVGTWLMRKTTEPLSPAWWIGMVEHFFNGSIVFPLLYSSVGNRIRRGGRLVRGAVWGALIWLLGQVVAMPLMGYGIFSSDTAEPGLYLLATLFAYAIYGVIFGMCAGNQTSRGRARIVEDPPGATEIPTPEHREAA